MSDVKIEYKGVSQIYGPLIVIENVQNVGYDEIVRIKTPGGETRLGNVIEVTDKAVTVQVFEGTRSVYQLWKLDLFFWVGLSRCRFLSKCWGV